MLMRILFMNEKQGDQMCETNNQIFVECYQMLNNQLLNQKKMYFANCN